MKFNIVYSLFLIGFVACSVPRKTPDKKQKFTGGKGKVKLMTLSPGHFHAALVQKNMYPQIDSTVYVYAPDGPELQDYLNQINRYNTRMINPAGWIEKVYTGSDFLEKMFAEKPGNVMVTAGNDEKKTEYILKSVQNGINVLADKPMVISPEKFPMLIDAFDVALQNQVLLYDIMTERFEVTTILQRILSQVPEVFGALVAGTPEDPAITEESVHNFFKNISGIPIQRPTWFFDVNQEGEGIVDVATHLVDLIQWDCFPKQVIQYQSDIKILKARHWTTDLTPEQFEIVTGEKEFPDFLQPNVDNGVLKVFSNGEFIYQIKGINAKVSVVWKFQSPDGRGDTHHSVMRGTKSILIIKQDAEENYKPTLYVKSVDSKDITHDLKIAIDGAIQKKFPGIGFEKIMDGLWRITIPEKYDLGHEAHFAQVTEKYLQYLIDGKLPDWEVPNMLAKYYTTTEALKMARNQK